MTSRCNASTQHGYTTLKTLLQEYALKCCIKITNLQYTIQQDKQSLYLISDVDKTSHKTNQMCHRKREYLLQLLADCFDVVSVERASVTGKQRKWSTYH